MEAYCRGGWESIEDAGPRYAKAVDGFLLGGGTMDGVASIEQQGPKRPIACWLWFHGLCTHNS